MSINFNNPMNNKALEKLRELISDGSLPAPVAQDDYRALFNKRLDLQPRKLTELANAAKQPVTVELNEEGEIKEMSDGTKYKVTRKGWIKI